MARSLTSYDVTLRLLHSKLCTMFLVYVVVDFFATYNNLKLLPIYKWYRYKYTWFYSVCLILREKITLNLISCRSGLKLVHTHTEHWMNVELLLTLFVLYVKNKLHKIKWGLMSNYRRIASLSSIIDVKRGRKT